MVCAIWAAGPGIANAPLLGSWCGQGDAAIWLDRHEAILGEHAFCRWDPMPGAGASYTGVLLCRTSEHLGPASVEHPLAVALSLDPRGRLRFQETQGGRTETWTRCDGT